VSWVGVVWEVSASSEAWLAVSMPHPLVGVAKTAEGDFDMYRLRMRT
jgi:hypothetical protein